MIPHKSPFCLHLFSISFLSFSLLAATVFAQSQPAYTKMLTEEKLYISPESARGGTDDQVFKMINFVPLETTQESLFGKIAKMETTEKYFVISDEDTRSILIFDKQGKFKVKIDGTKFKNGLNTEFTIDQTRKLIITRNSRTLLSFNFDGKLVMEKPMDDIYSTIASLDSSTLVYSPFTFLSTNVKKDSVNYFIKYLKDIKLDKQLWPFNVLEYGTPPNLSTMDVAQPYHFYYSGMKNRVLFTANYSTKIHVLDSYGIKNSYHLIFPQVNSLPEDSLSKLKSVVEKETYLKKNDKQIYNLRGLYTVGDNLYFETVMTSLLAKDRYFVYNLRTKSLISLNRVSPGVKSGYLPLLSYYGSLVACDGEFIYSTVSSLDLFQAKEANAAKNPGYPPNLTRYFQTQSRKSNPVIVCLQPKG